MATSKLKVIEVIEHSYTRAPLICNVVILHKNIMISFLTILSRSLKLPEWEIVHRRIFMEYYRLSLHPELEPPLIAQQLLVSGEDHRHAIHPGFDPIAIMRALWRRITSNRLEGASTIEQQIVRVITGNYQRTFKRKIKEIILAFLVDRYFPKNILPSIYLSIAYYGWRMNGYSQACTRLGFSPNSLTIEEAAGLVARLKYPEPQNILESRSNQIKRRINHLIFLNMRHKQNYTYRYLNVSTIHSKSRTFPAYTPLPQRG